jgi:hypothetical protein
MSQHAAFRRQPVPQQVAQAQKTITIPAPTRGITLDENDAFMKPGAAIISENWAPTLRGIRLRGGSVLWSTLPAAVVSGFEYVFGAVAQMFAATATTLYDVTAGGTATVVKAGQTSGNYSASQMATIDGISWLIAVNETGDFPLRYKNGSTWLVLDPTTIAVWVNNFAYTVGTRARDTSDNTFWKVAYCAYQPRVGHVCCRAHRKPDVLDGRHRARWRFVDYRARSCSCRAALLRLEISQSVLLHRSRQHERLVSADQFGRRCAEHHPAVRQCDARRKARRGRNMVGGRGRRN